MGLGTNGHYSNSANLGLLKKRVKFFNFTNNNNTGNIALSQVKNTGTINITEFQTNKKVEKQNYEVINIDNLTSSNFSNNEDVFNNSFLNSLNFITNLSENTKLRSVTYYTSDKINKQNSNFVQYFIEPETIEYSEINDINIKDISFATEFELKHFNNAKTYYVYDFTFENNPTKKDGNIILNKGSILQSLNDKKNNFFNHLNITHKLSENELFTFYAYLGLNNTKQEYKLQSDNDNSKDQNSNTPLNYYGLFAEILGKSKKSEYSLEISGNVDKDEINSTFIAESQIIIDSISNNTTYKNSKFSLKGSYTYKISQKTELKVSAIFSQNSINLNNHKTRLFFINPKIRFSIRRTTLGNFGFSYSFKNNLPEIRYLNENYMLENYRTFSRGTQEINQTANQRFGLFYTFNNYKKQFLINSYLSHSFSNKDYSSNSLINEDFNFNQFRIIDGGRNTNYNLGITRYFNKLSTSFKISTVQNWSKNAIIINDVNDKLNSYSASYRAQGTTYFKFPLNFKFYFQYNYSKSKFNNQTTLNDYMESSLNATLKFSKQWILQFNNNYYSINNKDFLFSNAIINYNPKKSRFSYRLTGNNLLDINEYSDIFISEFQRNESSFKILPRYILLNIKYRF